MDEISFLPGRVRLKEPTLMYDRQRAKGLNIYIDNLYGVKECRINPYTATILILYDSEKISIKSLKKRISLALNRGFDLEDYGIIKNQGYYKTIDDCKKARGFFLLYDFIFLAVLGKGFVYGKSPSSKNFRLLHLAAILTIIEGYPTFRRLYRAFTAILPVNPDMFLTFLAIVVTVLRESTEGVFVLLLKYFGDYVKLSSDITCQRQLLQSIGRNYGLVWKEYEKGKILTPVSSINPGDLIFVYKKETIPLAGEIVEGKALVNGLLAYGQPLVYEMEMGHHVDEGLTILSGKLKIRVTKTTDIIVKPDISLEASEIHRSLADFTNGIFSLSFPLAVISFIITGNILSSLSVLLLFTPSGASVTLNSGLQHYVSMLRKHGIYLRNPNVFERVSKVEQIVFDKTGTLTYGIMKIIKIIPIDDIYSEEKLLSICADCQWEHYNPISITLKDRVHYKTSYLESSVFIPSKGVIARLRDMDILIGNRRLMEENSIDISGIQSIYVKYQYELNTPVIIAINGKVAGLLILDDIIRKGAYTMIDELKNRGYGNLTMLTGDEKHKAEEIASQLGIMDVYSNCSNYKKEGIIGEMSASSPVMMIGDGINDVLAMKRADISVSFTHSAWDKVKLNSDCIIFEDNMERLADFITLSKKSYDIINWNIGFSKYYNLFWGSLAVFGFIDPFGAKTLNTFNSLFIMLLNLRIGLLQPYKK